MAKVNAKLSPLVISLGEPGMTPMLCAGLGGLAASLRAILREQAPSAEWPSLVSIGPGKAHVEKRRVTIDFGGSTEETLKALFTASLRISEPLGVIDLPGTYDATHPLDVPVAVALQGAVKRTFLQHGKSTSKAGAARTVTRDLGDGPQTMMVQPYASFAHQDAWSDVAYAVKRGAIELAGWAYPGAAQRHIAFGETRCSYSPSLALCACFAIVGCVSYQLPHNGGAIVIPEPIDLIEFAEARRFLTPRTLVDVHVSGAGDAALSAALALRMDEVAQSARDSVQKLSAVILRATAWDSKQKYRVATLTLGDVDEGVLDQYHAAVSSLPPRVIALKEQRKKEEQRDSFFVAPSPLRGLIADNLARARPWFVDFARLHQQLRDQARELSLDEKKGLITMVEKLEIAEHALVKSVHVALRQRFGAIADESRDNPATMKNRFQGERDKWRLAFAGAKTLDQLRAALADLWSRAGANEELRDHWPAVMQLLRPNNWRQARDLALVALASYQREHKEEEKQS